MFKIFSTYICWTYKMQHLEVSGAVRPIYGSLGVEGLIYSNYLSSTCSEEINYIHYQELLTVYAAYGSHAAAW